MWLSPGPLFRNDMIIPRCPRIVNPSLSPETIWSYIPHPSHIRPTLGRGITMGSLATKIPGIPATYDDQRQNPKFHETQRGRAEVYALLARDAELGGGDATAAVRDGLAAAAAAVLGNPIDGPSHAIKARLHLLAARLLPAAAGARVQAILDGEAEARQAIKCDPDLSEAHILLAQSAGLRGVPEEGLLEVKAALAKNPHQAEALAVQAALLHQQQEQARAAQKGAAAGALREQSARLLSQALAINPYLHREYAQLLTAALVSK